MLEFSPYNMLYQHSPEERMNPFNEKLEYENNYFNNELSNSFTNVLSNFGDFQNYDFDNQFSYQMKLFLIDEKSGKKNFIEEQKLDDLKEESKSENSQNSPKLIENKESNCFTHGISTTQLTNKKRGRGKNLEIKSKIHDRKSSDNIQRKLQVHYISFINSFFNEILENFHYEERFLKIDYGFKKNIKKSNIEALKNMTIEEILSQKISEKYIKLEQNTNMNIIKTIKENKNEVLKKLLSENYLTFFKKFYYNGNKIINLEKYGLNKKIKLSNNVKTFKDLLEDKEAIDEDRLYNIKLNENAIQNFLPKSIFMINYSL